VTKQRKVCCARKDRLRRGIDKSRRSAAAIQLAVGRVIDLAADFVDASG